MNINSTSRRPSSLLKRPELQVRKDSQQNATVKDTPIKDFFTDVKDATIIAGLGALPVAGMITNGLAELGIPDSKDKSFHKAVSDVGIIANGLGSVSLLGAGGAALLGLPGGGVMVATGVGMLALSGVTTAFNVASQGS